ncbi:MAG: DUF4253 domain-containing protein [Myxococcales bacterium]|nr:DUF4253 domain-containing protein [Myxococcales bacterium]
MNRKTALVGGAAVVAMVAALAIWASTSTWWRVDRCLDRGGCWVYGEERCEWHDQAACDGSKATLDKPALSRPEVPRPVPPSAGHAKLAVTGALNLDLDEDGAVCGEGGTPDQFWVFATGDPEWSLSYLPEPGATVRFGNPEGKYEVYKAPAPNGVRREGSGFRVDQRLTSEGGKAVRVVGHVSCPSWPSDPAPEVILAILKDATRGKPRRYSTYDFGRARYPGAASAIVPEAQARSSLAHVRALLPEGWVAYIGTTQWLGEEKHPGEAEIVVGPGASQFAILRLARSDAVNYDMGTEALIRTLSAWDAEYGVDVLHAETDTIELALENRPSEPLDLAKRVYEFCPDSVDQGTGTVEKLAEAIASTGEVYLWWD